MSIQDQKRTLPPLESILEWSQDRPDWQRDALRRLVELETLTETDHDELERLCRRKHNVLVHLNQSINSIPLSSAHLPKEGDSTLGITLVSLGELENVNRLAPNQILSFGTSPGITVIYGDNGAGKSSYARVIKKACRCRGQAAPILHDCRSPSPKGPASAKFNISHGEIRHEIVWQDGTASDDRLGRIFLFDAASADHYISDDDGTAFVPFGLDILEKLARICSLLNQRLKTRQQEISTEIEGIRKTWKNCEGTLVGKFLSQLSAKTTPERISEISAWTDDADGRIADIRTLLTQDGEVQAAKTLASANRVAQFRARLAVLEKGLCEESVQKLREALSQEQEASDAVRKLAENSFDDAFLAGTGNKMWRVMWNAARDFSTQSAYQTSEFPFLGDQAKCVLCQTSLSDEAKQNLTRFDAHVKQTISDHAQSTKLFADALRESFRLLSDNSDQYRAILTDLGGLDDTALSKINTKVESLNERRKSIDLAVKEGTWAEIPAVSESVESILLSLEASLQTKANGEKQSSDPTVREQLRLELSELLARQWLAESREGIASVIEKHQTIEKLKKCIADTAPLQITNKSKELATLHVTQAFCDRFAEEMSFLELDSVQVDLQTRGEKGVTRIGVRLQGAPNQKLMHVASEGERRCIALALFFAELSQAVDTSALVFDDPVSSLDHERRARIAERLAQEAKTRQVIVFTHDLSFLGDLQYFADDRIDGRHIDWVSGAPGRCHDELPWKAQSTKSQMKSLREECNRLKKTHREQGQKEYEEHVGKLADMIRYAAERIVEEVLFGDVIRRHDCQIKMGNLEKVGVVEYEDYQAVFAVWRECSQIIPGHAHSRSKSIVMPQPDRINDFIENLGNVVEKVRDRRKTAADSPMPPAIGLAKRSTN